MIVVRGDITAETTDAVVNPANEWLAPGGGLCGQFFTAAGHADLVAACEAIGRCEPGSAVVTDGFRLPAKWLVHAVGPEWRGGSHGEADTLASAYRSALTVAIDVGARSIAFPAISTGLYGYPKVPATQIAIAVLADAPIDVRVVAFDDETHDLYRSLL